MGAFSSDVFRFARQGQLLAFQFEDTCRWLKITMQHSMKLYSSLTGARLGVLRVAATLAASSPLFCVLPLHAAPIAQTPEPDAPKPDADEQNNLFPDASFEAKAPTTGRVGELYLNVVGAPMWDNSGDKARTGKAALGIGAKSYLTGGVSASAGKRYRLRGHFRAQDGEAVARLQINWKRADNSVIKTELQRPSLTTNYQVVEIVTQAPPETASAALIISGAAGDEGIWLDDVFYGEAVEK